jgi:hypothetical protein
MSTPLTQIQPKEIEQLNAEQLVQLLHHLLLCEARQLQLSKHGILVPFQINVPDGGCDGEWNAEIGAHEYIPSSLTYYQCKAEHITSTDCANEVSPCKKVKGKTQYLLKDRVRDVLSRGGCYAFFSSKHEIKPSKTSDPDTVVRKRLAEANFTPHPNAKIEFFGCNRIAAWANRFPSAVRFVREITKDQGGIHYFTIDGWARLLAKQGPYYSNEVLREKISTLRNALSKGETRVIRLTGSSGLGKTRLVYEALKYDQSDTVIANALSAATIYLRYDDVCDNLMNFINHLADGGYAAVVVIDDCPASVHDRIVETINSCELSVVSIFYEPQAQRQDTQPLTIEPEALGDVVEKILRESPQLLEKGEESIKAVAKFAGGFPQIAKLIAEFHRAPTIHELEDRDALFGKLLGGGSQPDNTTLKVVQSIALFRTIGGSKKKLESDLKLIRSRFCPEVSETDFNRVVATQERRSIIQQTADTLMVTPRPLAVALVEDFLSICPGNWKEHIDALKEAGLAESLVHRIEELELSEKSEELGRLFLEEKLPFDDAEYLLSGTTGSQMFCALTVLNPSSACKVAQRTINRASLDRLSQATSARHSLVHVLRLMVWDDKTFSSAAQMLLKLAAAENESWANNATREFTQLFHLKLSGTTVSANDRLPILREALDSDEPRIRQVAVKALGSALQDGSFSRMGDATLGGKRDAHKDWQPSTWGEIFSYWRESYLMLQHIIIENAPEAPLAMQMMAQNINGILKCPLLLELDPNFRCLAEKLNGSWPEMKSAIRSFLEHRDSLPADRLVVLNRWIGYLTPPSEAINERLLDIVSKPGWRYDTKSDGKYVDLAQVDAVNLAKEFAQASVDLRPLISRLLKGEQQQAYWFGDTLARQHPSAKELIESVLQVWPSLMTDQRNDSLIKGLMHGLSDRDYQTAILERVSADPQLVPLLIPLTTALSPITETDFLRIKSSVVQCATPVESLRHLIPGQPLHALPDSFVKNQFEEIAHAVKDAAPVLFDVLFSLSYRDSEKFAYFKDTFRMFVLTPGLPIKETHLGWEWHETVIALLKAPSNEQFHRDLAGYLVNYLRTDNGFLDTSNIIDVAVQLFRHAPTVSWQVFASALSEDDEMLRYSIADFIGGGGIRSDDYCENFPLGEIPMHQFDDWVVVHLDLIPLLLDHLQLFTVTKGEDGKELFHWHPYSLLLLERASNEDEALNHVFGNLYSFGSTGSRIPYWERRRALADELLRSSNVRLKRIGRVLAEKIDGVIDRERREEQNEQALYQ